jgi:hypothetical protein
MVKKLCHQRKNHLTRKRKCDKILLDALPLCYASLEFADSSGSSRLLATGENHDDKIP